MNDYMRCCVPACRFNVRTKHISFYGVKPDWRIIIRNYIKEQKKSTDLCSNLICGKHFRLIGIRDVSRSGSSVIYFPHLKISVSREPQKAAPKFKYLQTLTNEEIAIHHEEVVPRIPPEIQIDLSKPKRVIKAGFKRKHTDHDYALTDDYIKFLRDEFETQEDTRESKLLNTYKKEIQRLRDVNHDLLKSNIKHIHGTLEHPFKCIPDNEQMLKFYTGFTSKQAFLNFVDLIKPKYDMARFGETPVTRKLQIEMVDQLVLVLCRLRLGLMHHDLAYRFNTSVNTILKIWMFWVKLLSEVLVTESCNLDEQSVLILQNNENQCNNKIIVELYETLFEDHTDRQKKMYGRVRALIEVTPKGFVVNASDLFASHVGNEQIIKSCPSRSQRVSRLGYALDKKNQGRKGNMGKVGRFTLLQTHIQKILGFIKGFKILKGTFPNSVCNVIQLNVYWKICCFLVNYIHVQTLVALAHSNVGTSKTKQ